MALGDITQALGDNTELIAEVKEYFSKSQDVATRVNNLEKMRDEAVSKYKNLKDTVKGVTGLSELSKESIAKAFTSDEALEALKTDNLTLQQTMELLKEEKDGLSATHESELSKMIMLEQLRGMEVDSQVWNPRALEDLANDLLKGTKREDRKFTFTNEDNTTKFNSTGQQMSVSDRIEELKASGDAYYFKPATGAGGGQGNNPTPTKAVTTDNERAAAMLKKMRTA